MCVSGVQDRQPSVSHLKAKNRHFIALSFDDCKRGRRIEHAERRAAFPTGVRPVGNSTQPVMKFARPAVPRLGVVVALGRQLRPAKRHTNRPEARKIFTCDLALIMNE
jgi:hypothetical protein